MTDKGQKSVEFDAVIGADGTISIPASVLERFEKGSGKVHVRLSGRQVASELKDRDVSEDEIQRIAGIQLESHDQVVKFLMSEGALRTNRPFVRRALALKRMKV
ncbi:MAG: hypothetical protein HY708_06260 [Ignavibacteriae bacterium]|nr:hypothetical protein [Ignavibacteriota bacterium]